MLDYYQSSILGNKIKSVSERYTGGYFPADKGNSRPLVLTVLWHLLTCKSADWFTLMA